MNSKNFNIELYKQKYLKYKQKYLKYKQEYYKIQKGGTVKIGYDVIESDTKRRGKIINIDADGFFCIYANKW